MIVSGSSLSSQQAVRRHETHLGIARVHGVDGADYYVYHAWEKNRVGGGNARLGVLDKVTWLDGWPRINDGKPSLGNCDAR